MKMGLQIWYTLARRLTREPLVAFISSCPLWVKSCRSRHKQKSSLLVEQRTFSFERRMSALCQKLTLDEFWRTAANAPRRTRALSCSSALAPGPVINSNVSLMKDGRSSVQRSAPRSRNWLSIHSDFEEMLASAHMDGFAFVELSRRFQSLASRNSIISALKISGFSRCTACAHPGTTARLAPGIDRQSCWTCSQA